MDLRSFVSSRHITVLREGPQRVEGALLHVDISGFTALTEQLGARGKTGTETLTHLLQQVYSSLLQTIRRFTGEVLVFQGDGLLVGFYPGSGAGDPLHRAVACGHAMLGNTRDFEALDTPWGTYPVRFRVSVAKGRWLEAVVGTKERAELLLQGPPFAEVYDMIRRAAPGTLWVEGEQMNRPASVPEAPGREDEDHHDETGDGLGRFLPFGVTDFLQTTGVGEHRVVSVLFLGVDAGTGAEFPVQPFQDLFGEVYRTVRRHGGVLARLDPTSTGVRMLLLFGAPMAREHSVLHAVACARELAQRSFSPFSVRVAGSTGFVYSGVVGDAWRREFTVLGDAVNLAARLCSLARPGVPVVDDTTHRLTRHRMLYTQEGAVVVRGKREPVQQWRPLRPLSRTGTPFVGRDDPLRRVLLYLQKTPRIWLEVMGEAGAGKTRFLEELGKSAGAERTVLRAGAVEGVPFALFRDLMRRAAHIRPEDPPGLQEEKLDHLLEEMDAPPELVRRRTFLSGMLLGLEVQDPLYLRLDPELRFANLKEALRLFFALHARERPLLLLLDDVDRCSREEQQLLRDVLMSWAREAPHSTVGVVWTHRRASHHLPEPPDGYTVESVELHGFDREEIRTWVTRMLGGPVEEAVVELLYRWTRGLPFMLEEYLWYLVDQGILENSEDGWHVKQAEVRYAIPENVWTLMMARMDRLSAPARKGLKVGSVAGLRFPGAVISRVLPDGGPRALFEATREGILVESAEQKDWWAFRHALMQEVLYDALLSEERAHYHREVGYALEGLAEKGSHALASVLARHFREGKVWERALRYTLQAARYARETFQNEDALQHLRIARDLLKTHFPEDRSALFQVLEWLGEVLHRVGRMEEAFQIYHEMEAIFPVPSRQQVRALWSQAKVRIDQSRFQEAEDLLERALKTLKDLPDEVRNRLEYAHVRVLQARLAQIQKAHDRAIKNAKEALDLLKSLRGTSELDEEEWSRAAWNAHNLLCVTGISSGDFRLALRHGEAALHLAQQVGDRMKEAQSSGNLGLIYYDLGDLERARTYMERDIEISREIGHLQGMAATLSNLGLVYLRQGAYDRAHQVFSQALRIVRRLGLRYYEAKMLCNLGVVSHEQGKWEDARAYFLSFREVSREIQYRAGEALAALNLGGVLLRIGDLEEAYHWLQEAERLLQEKEDPYNQVELHLVLGRYWQAKGDISRARAEVAAAFRLARSMGVPSMEALAVAQQAALSTDPVEARTLWEQAIAQMQELGMHRYRADTLVAYARFLKAQGDPTYRERLNEALQIYTQLHLDHLVREVKALLSD